MPISPPEGAKIHRSRVFALAAVPLQFATIQPSPESEHVAADPAVEIMTPNQTIAIPAAACLFTHMP